MNSFAISLIFLTNRVAEVVIFIYIWHKLGDRSRNLEDMICVRKHVAVMDAN